MKKLFSFLFVIALLCTMIHSCQVATPVQTRMMTLVSDSVAQAPSLRILGPKENEVAPSLSSLSISIETWGNTAVTTMDMVFYNPNNRVLEGEMVFPLREGQSISKLLVEKNGTLVEGVVVEKNKGQQVFESIERKNVDPVLVEHVAGNNYRIRIYPIAAKGTQHIIISYEQALELRDDFFFYDLPLNYGIEVQKFDIKARVHNALADTIHLNQPQIMSPFQLMEEGSATAYSANPKMLNEHFAFIIPLKGKKETVISQYEHNENRTYFFACLKLPGVPRPKPRPQKIALYWDVSGSCDSSSQAMMREMMQSYITQYKPTQVDVFPFSIAIHDRQTFITSDGSAGELVNYLEGLRFDGGTQLGCIEPGNDFSEIFLVSDGMSNYGKDEMMLPSVPVSCITASTSSNASYLQWVAQSTGGTYIDLSRTDVSTAMRSLGEQPMKLLSATVPSIAGQLTSETVFPSRGIITGNTLTIAGYSEAPGDLLVRVGYDEASAYTLPVKIETNSTGIIAKRMWVQKKIETLKMQPEKNREEIIEVATKHQVVTPFTSLIVLETLEDYVEYEIAPPAAMREAYDKALAEKVKQKETIERTHMEQVVTWFRTREEWWQKDFTPEHFILKEKKEETDKSNANGGVDRLEFSTIEITEERIQEVMIADRAYSSSVTREGNGAGSLGFATGGVPANLGDSTGGMVDTNGKYKASMELKKWDPETPYMKKLKSVSQDKLYDEYLTMRKEYTTTPSFFVDVADYMEGIGQHENAIRVLSNLAETDINNYRLMRVLAYRLLQLDHREEAIALFRKVMVLRKEEPQSYRDLSLALAENKQYQEAIETMYKVVSKKWDSRFPEIELIAAGEMNNIIAKSDVPVNTSFIEPKLLKHLPMDVRVILNWDADNCDIDLWVTDPRGEKCFYSHRDTKIGGHNSCDLTGGYGPEEFIIKKAMKGKYKVEINYYGDRQQSIAGPTTIQLEMYTGYGRSDQKLNTITRRLSEKKEILEIGTFVVE